MTKTTKTVPAYAIGDRVTVTTAATHHEPATGTVQNTTATGWYVCQLDEPDRFTGCPNGKVSARLSSLQPATANGPKAGSVAAQLQAANGKQPKAPAVPKTPPVAYHLPTVCPECGCTSLDVSKDDDGNTTYACTNDDCGWEATFEPDPTHASRMAEALRKARANYAKDKRPDGSATAHCGDAIAKELRDLEPQDVANLADKVLGQTPGFHFGKYQHLNNGQIRMNSGNRIRSYWKQINEDGNTDEIARVSDLLNLTADETPEE